MAQRFIREEYESIIQRCTRAQKNGLQMLNAWRAKQLRKRLLDEFFSRHNARRAYFT